MTAKKTITGMAKVERQFVKNGGLDFYEEAVYFDATAYIIDSPLNVIHELSDGDGQNILEITSDCVALEENLNIVKSADDVEWNVISADLMDSVKAYFGVDNLADVTQEMFDVKCEEYNEPIDYAVVVRRTVPALMTITVPARNKEEASEAALEMAKDGNSDCDWGRLLSTRMMHPDDDDFEVIETDVTCAVPMGDAVDIP